MVFPMSPPVKKEKENSAAPDSDSYCPEQPKPRAGLPGKNSVLKEKPFKSRSGKKYRIIKTTETDEYEKPEQPNSKMS